MISSRDSEVIEPELKKRKLAVPQAIYPLQLTANGTVIDNNHGTMTPLPNVHHDEQQAHQIDDDMMEVEQCPCGHLHGPGQGENHDILAVGLSSVPLLRGPD